MQIEDRVEAFCTAPGDHLVQQLESFRVVTLKQTVMQWNANSVEPGPMQEGNVLARDVVLAILLPECGRGFRSKEFQHQRADFARRLRAALEQPHVTFRHQPIPQIGGSHEERFTAGIDDLFVVGMRELRAAYGRKCQKKQQKSWLEHNFLCPKAYTIESFCWRQSK